jgi:hypothetical protein
MPSENRAIWVAQLIFNGLLTIASIGIWVATCTYTSVTQQNSRPWIYIAGVDTKTPHFSCASQGCAYTIVADEPLDIFIDYRNFGTNRARHTAIRGKLVSGGVAPQDVTKWNDNTAPTLDCKAILTSVDFGSLPPSSVITAHIDPSDKIALSAPDVNYISAGQEGLYYRGCISYQEPDGTQHRAEVCSYFNVVDAAKHTGTFNQWPKGEYDQ